MREYLDADDERRAFLKMAGGTAIILPLIGISACSKQEAAPPAAAPEPAPVAAAAPAAEPTVAAEPAPAPAAPAPAAPAPATPAAELVRLEESATLAVALGYRHDATQADKAKYPRYAAGQVCKGCIQWKGTATDAWAGCGIFPGKLVSANGWCSTFLAKT